MKGKCRKFGGFLVTYRATKANPDKIKAILDMCHPNKIRDVQCLTRSIEAISRFMYGPQTSVRPSLSSYRNQRV